LGYLVLQGVDAALVFGSPPIEPLDLDGLRRIVSVPQDDVDHFLERVSDIRPTIFATTRGFKI
jgi:hypothetical protein